jgi:hypothetical protein
MIVMPNGELTLIDGGDGVPEEGEESPLAWMERRGAEALDWMILTHLHEDHLNGLLQLAEVKAVRRAIMPYRPFEIPDADVLEQFGNREPFLKVYRLLQKYLHLLAVLEEQETKVLWRTTYGSKELETVWSHAGCTLTHLYPWMDDPLPGWDILQKAMDGYREGSPDWHIAFERFFGLSNHDSSVYRLTSKEQGVLFGGDLLTEGWQRLSARTDLRTPIWKVPHHGMPDAFNETTLALVRPEHSIVPIRSSLAGPLQDHWRSLSGQTGLLRMTGQSRLIFDFSFK